MKRIGLILACLLVGCSSAPQNAGETVSESVRETDDALGAWVARFVEDEEVLSELNALSSGNGAQSEKYVASCGDAEFESAWHSVSGDVVVNSNARIDKSIAILEGISSTGSKYVPSHLSRIKTLAEGVKASERSSFSWSEGDAVELASQLRKRGFSPEKRDYETARDEILDALKGADCEQILGRYCSWAKSELAKGGEQADARSELDVLLACDLTGWARALRLDYPKNDYAFDRFRPYMSDEAIISLRVKHFVKDLAKSGPEIALGRLAPPDEQYEKLIAARKIYVDAIEAGGWPAVEQVPANLEAKIDKSYSWVPSLKKRLAAEGYKVSNLDSDVFDEETRAAVELYREMHQLNTKKLVDPTLVKNMAVSPETRLENIDLTIQRYRETPIGSLDYYIKVNVPDFYGEVWKSGNMIKRFKIVAGNNNVERDPETKKIVPDDDLYPLHPNRTPIQSSKINEVIYNPYWNVPARIRQQELEPKLAANPNYYAEHNYEEVNVGDPKLYYVRELPNPKNSLGKVKMMFPNPHNTYLHDTPSKGAFSNPTRALSHGCMRVQNPLDLAELLLKNDGQWDAQKVNGILNAKTLVEEHIMLKSPVDVDVVYLNNRVDESGVVGFLSDVYEYDAVRLGRVKLSKLPRPAGWKPKK